MSYLSGAVLGLLQGLCEFLPVSSSGHLLLAQILMGMNKDNSAMMMLEILLHIGTLIPVLVVFRREWIDMIAHPVKNRTLALLIAGSLPTLAIYIGAKLLFKEQDGFGIFESGWFLGPAFLMTAVFLLICDRAASRKNKKTKVGFLNAVFMGIFQGIGMIPGVSRSGSTITGGVATGLEKKAAARFSFMMSAPAILGSFLMEGKDALESDLFSKIEWGPTVVGILIAMISGFFAIRFMLKIIEKVPLSWFALYLALIGVAYLILQFTGALQGIPAFSVPQAAAEVIAVG